MKIFFLLLFILPNLLFAQQQLPPLKIALFKNGVVHVVRTGTINFSNKKARIDVPDRILLGSYWISLEKGSAMHFMNDTIKNTRPVETLEQLLAENKNGSIAIELSEKGQDNKNAFIKGKLLEFNSRTGLAKIKQENNQVKFINLMAYKLLSVVGEGDLKDKMSYDSIFRMGVIEAVTDLDKIPTEVHYLTTGMTWHPSYFIKLMPKNECRIEMKAVIENNLEHFDKVETNLVIGSPNFKYGMAMDPLSAFATQRINYSNIVNPYSNSLRTDISGAFAPQQDESAPAFNNNYSASGEKNEDLFMYQLGKISLVKGSKDYYPIFASKISYEDQYKANITDYNAYHSTRTIDVNSKSFDVLHYIEIQNSTKYPLSTGPVFIENDKSNFLGQAEITYTPINEKRLVYLSQANDIILKSREEETSKELNYKVFNKVNYLKTSLKGTIMMENFLDKSVKLIATKTLTGEVTNKGNGKLVSNPISNNINSTSTLEFIEILKPGEKKEISYEYFTYIRAY